MISKEIRRISRALMKAKKVWPNSSICSIASSGESGLREKTFVRTIVASSKSSSPVPGSSVTAGISGTSAWWPYLRLFHLLRYRPTCRSIFAMTASTAL
jgi:hypothetical protein